MLTHLKQKRSHLKNYYLKIRYPSKVSVSTNYNTIVEAMKSKKVDVGFLPPTAYTLAHDQKQQTYC